MDLAPIVAAIQAGDGARARRLADQALAAAPNDPHVRHLSGVIALQAGDGARAVADIQAAIAADGAVAAFHANLGLALQGMGDWPGAEAALGRAIDLAPDLADPRDNLGLVLARRGDRAGALRTRRHALALDPARAAAWANLSGAARDLDQRTLAEHAARRAVQLAPTNPDALIALAAALKARNRLEAAEAVLADALTHAPGDTLALTNLGLIRQARGAWGEAEALFRHAMERGEALAAWNFSLLALRQGRLAEGWATHAARWTANPDPMTIPPSLPPWDGGPLNGRRLLIWREQGLGDEILFGGALPDLLRRVGGEGAVIVAVEPRLVGLFARALPTARVVPAPVGQPIADHGADVALALAGLPGLVRPHLVAFPSTGHWLKADPARVASWRARVDALGPGLRIGVVWRGHLATSDRVSAYLEPGDLAPLAGVPGVRLINLRHDLDAPALAEAARAIGAPLAAWDDLDLRHDIDGVAALIANLDLVIAVACAAGELAAALGVPVWRIGARDWTWLGTGCRPWHPTQRVWAPASGAPLASVVSAMARALTQLVPVLPARSDPPKLDQLELDQLMMTARLARARGDGAGAERALQAVLELAPDHAEARAAYARLAFDHGRPDLVLALFQDPPVDGAGALVLGLACQALGDWPGAARWLGRAAIDDPTNIQAVGNLAAVQVGLGDPRANINAHAATRLAPGDAGVWLNRALAEPKPEPKPETKPETGPARAAAACRVALSLDPGLMGAWIVLSGRVDDGRAEEGVELARRALWVAPEHAEGLAALAAALVRAARWEEAEATCRRALAQRPLDTATLINLATALGALGRVGAAAWAWWAVILTDPGLGEGFAGLANLRAGAGAPERALKGWERAITLDPRRADWRYNHGNALRALGRDEGADAEWRAAAAIDPALAVADFNRGYVALARGDMAEGWGGLERRFSAGQAKPDRHFPQPRWHGGPLDGGALLIWREQGIGDELMFASCLADAARLARARGASAVVVEAEPRLVGLIQRAHPELRVRAERDGPLSDEADQEGGVAAHIPIGSLPLLTREKLAAFGARSAWVAPDPELVALWRERLAELGAGPRIGICWRTGLNAPDRQSAITDLIDWAPLLTIPGMVWVNLQYDLREEAREAERRAVEVALGVTIHHWADTDLKRDLEAAAALTSRLDLVISVGTSVAEMAGALGVPVWRIGAPGEWSALGAGCRPWYPSQWTTRPRPGETSRATLGRLARRLAALAPTIKPAEPPPPAPPKSEPVSTPTPRLPGGPADWLARGMTAHRAGDLAGAETHYRAIIARDANHGDANHLLGMTLAAQGRHGEAAEPLFRAVATLKRAPDPRANLAHVLMALERPGEAEAQARAALKLAPRHPEAANTLGNALAAQARWGEARTAYEVALRARPEFAEARANLGVALAGLGEDVAAEAALRAALPKAPRHGPARGALAGVLARRGDLAAARRLWRQWLALQPDQPVAWERMAEALAVDGETAVAKVLARAVRLAPSLVDSWAALGRTWRFQGMADRAARAFALALVLEPTRASLASNRALALDDLGDAQAARWHDRAATIDPDDGLARFNRALPRLARGTWREGWRDHDGRLVDGGLVRRPRLAAPPWRGEPLAGRHILVWREQGLGDEVMFSALYPALVARAGAVTIACDPRLKTLYARSFPTARVVSVAEAERDPDPSVDFQTAAGSTARHLARGLADFPAPLGGWLRPDPARLAATRARLAPLGDGLRVGIAWSSAKRDMGRERAYTQLEAWRPLLATPGVIGVNSQYDDRGVEISAFNAVDRAVGLVHLSDLDLMNDLEAAAALAASCDLVVTVANSVGEMAAAVGVPVWRLAGPDWTSIGTAVRPWYPTMRLWPPGADGMASALERVVRALSGVIAGKGGP